MYSPQEESSSLWNVLFIVWCMRFFRQREKLILLRDMLQVLGVQKGRLSYEGLSVNTWNSNPFVCICVCSGLYRAKMCVLGYTGPKCIEIKVPHKFYCTFEMPRLVTTRVKKNQLDAQIILSIFRQPLHVSGVSRSIIRRYNRMYTAVGTYYSF
jgi:hypothetical protein